MSAKRGSQGAAKAKRPAAATRTRRVKVSFLRAIPRDPIRPGLSWPDDGDVRTALLDGFDKGEGVMADWPIATSWGRSFLVEAHGRAEPVQLGVGAVRDDVLPLVLRAGARTGEPLPMDARDRLLEPSYLTFFGDRVVAFVKTEHSPGPNQCARALAEITLVDLELVPIPRPEILQSIHQGYALATFGLTVAAGSVDVASERDDLVRAAEELRAGTGGAERLTVTVGAQTQDQKRQLRTRVIRLLNRRGTAGLAAAYAGVLSEEVGYEVVNLLQEDISTMAAVTVSARTRSLLPSEAHEAALQAFEFKQAEITHSIALADA